MGSSMKVGVASGKGGTGKTTIATNLAAVAESPNCFVDCDVEAPNGHLFLKSPETTLRTVTVPVPDVTERRCTGCGRCVAACQFNALALVQGRIRLFSELCHSCGACGRVCHAGAIQWRHREVGSVSVGKRGGTTVVTGRLNVTEARGTPVIDAAKALAPATALTIIDAPPGTSCGTVHALEGVDLALLVTEPTPMGLHDLKLAVQLTRRLEIPCVVCLNRAGVDDFGLHAFCEQEGLDLVMEFPKDRRYAQAYAEGRLLCEVFPELSARFRELLVLLRNSLQPAEAAHDHSN